MALRSHGAASSPDDCSSTADSARSTAAPASARPATEFQSQLPRPASAHVIGRAHRTPRAGASVLLACRDPSPDRMACSRRLLARPAITLLAPGRTRKLLRRRTVVLVAGNPAVAHRALPFAMVHRFVPVPGYLAVRRTFGVPRLLRSRGLSGISFGPAAVRHDGLAGPGVCRRLDVGLRHVRIPSPGRFLNHESPVAL